MLANPPPPPFSNVQQTNKQVRQTFPRQHSERRASLFPWRRHHHRSPFSPGAGSLERGAERLAERVNAKKDVPSRLLCCFLLLRLPLLLLVRFVILPLNPAGLLPPGAAIASGGGGDGGPAASE